MFVKDLKLNPNEEIWGYTAPSVSVCNTDYQEFAEVSLMTDGRYKARVTGRPDYTGREDYFKSFSKALRFAGVDPNFECVQSSEGVYRFKGPWG